MMGTRMLGTLRPCMTLCISKKTPVPNRNTIGLHFKLSLGCNSEQHSTHSTEISCTSDTIFA